MKFYQNKMKKLFALSGFLFLAISCKKDTLVEVVDVPATPIVAPKQEKGKPSDVKAIEGAFVIPELGFDYSSLEPDFDAVTMEFHYSKHHLAYVNSLNKVMEAGKYQVVELIPLLKAIKLSDTDLRFNAGGVFNHNFFFEELAPKAGGEPEGELIESINRDFGSFEEFRNQFVEASLKLQGSGWTWLISDKTGKLRIVTSLNNDNPYIKNLGITGIPILNLDMWEHAYYLKFQHKKREYANTFFSVINWSVVQKRYEFPKVAVAEPKPEASQTIEVPVENTTPVDEFK